MRDFTIKLAEAIATGVSELEKGGVDNSPDHDQKRRAAVAEAEDPGWTGPVDIQPSQGDGWQITTPYGYIDYRHLDDDDINEIWWIESHKRGHGSQLVDLMQKYHPAASVAWGVTSRAGAALMRRWHAAHPDVNCIEGPHEGQFDPFGYSYGGVGDDDEIGGDESDDETDGDERDDGMGDERDIRD